MCFYRYASVLWLHFLFYFSFSLTLGKNHGKVCVWCLVGTVGYTHTCTHTYVYAYTQLYIICAARAHALTIMRSRLLLSTSIFQQSACNHASARVASRNDADRDRRNAFDALEEEEQHQQGS